MGQGGRSEGGREEVTAGHIRRRGYRFFVCLCLRHVFVLRWRLQQGQRECVQVAEPGRQQKKVKY